MRCRLLMISLGFLIMLTNCKTIQSPRERTKFRDDSLALFQAYTLTYVFNIGFSFIKNVLFHQECVITVSPCNSFL